MNKLNKIVLLALIVCVSSCKDSEKNDGNEVMSKTNIEERVSVVDTIHLTKSIFSKQITCNGKLSAVEKSNLNFVSSGMLSQINVKNGVRVKKDFLIASLDEREAKIRLGKAQQDLEMSYVSLLDNLIGQGYEADTTNVPKLVLKNAKMSSGYNSALYTLDEAQRSLEDCYLYAPFAGIIANMDTKKHESTVGSQFCTLIDDSYFDVEFNLLEAEIFDIAVGQTVKASMFVDSNTEYIGVIEQVNPAVDENGQVKVRAKIKNSNGKLIEGMNMKLIVERDIENMFVVPKDAVVSRDGFFVVFRLIDGAASWTYVDIVMSNIESHVITGCVAKDTSISTDDIIITSGNLNLADGTKVIAKKSNNK